DPAATGVHTGFLILIASGFIAGAITLVPGMSISAVLIVTGVFGQLLLFFDALLVGDFTYMPQILLFLVAAVLGLGLTSKGIKTMFEKAPGLSNTSVLGFMSGSLVGIFIQSLYEADPNFTWTLGVVMLIGGLLLSMLFVALGKSMGKLSDET
ncbi:MAG: DUF368 domain-containing protein, partial [Oscillospiraceae bacterium]|nr:DUF368 domain-containing protein [Oscillospiraceae bacterium]